ncbi:hypothetical protein MED121_05715 [Marinomonas sp. MED121]|nr:hypothetical protein MED121_05715 [Marinomonas sp. MED121]
MGSTWASLNQIKAYLDVIKYKMQAIKKPPLRRFLIKIQQVKR